jgi:hypothetical protein
MCAPAIVGAGGFATLPCPMRCTVNWKAPLKRMNSITLPATRGKQNMEEKSTWGAGRVVAARSVSPAGGIMTKTGRRSSRGSVVRDPWWCRPSRILPSRRCNRRLTSPSKRAVGSIPTRPAAIGRCRDTAMRSSITRRRNMPAARCMRIGRMPLLFAQALSAGVSWPQQMQLAGVSGLLSIPAERSTPECLRAGGADLAGSVRSNHCQ